MYLLPPPKKAGHPPQVRVWSCLMIGHVPGQTLLKAAALPVTLERGFELWTRMRRVAMPTTQLCRPTLYAACVIPSVRLRPLVWKTQGKLSWNSVQRYDPFWLNEGFPVWPPPDLK